MGFRWVVLVFILPGMSLGQSASAVLSSPDGRLSIAFHTVSLSPPVRGGESAPSPEPAPNGGQLVYEVSFRGNPLILTSKLRLDLEEQVALGTNVRIVNATTATTDETYQLLAGKASAVRDHFDALHLELEEPVSGGRKLVMEARAYDDAVAFRYLVPEQSALQEFRLAKEGTEFRISKDPFIYALFLPNFRSMYESEFLKLSASSLSNQGGVDSKVLVGLGADGNPAYGAPIQMVSDNPAAYKNQPSFDFIKAVPATWDETRVLNGVPGEYVTIARRHGKEWYLGSMTNWDARSLDLPLAFLDSGSYRAEIYADAKDADQSPKHISILKKTVDRWVHLKVQLVSGGGYAVRLVPIQPGKR